MAKQKDVEQAPELDEEDDEILDRVWDEIGSESKKSKNGSHKNVKKESFLKTLDLLKDIVDSYE